MTLPRRRPFQAFVRNEHGVAAPIIAVCLTLFIGLLALGLDIGHLYAARLRLQAATDAAALAGAQLINGGTSSTAISAATAYGPAKGEQNAGIFNASFVVGYPQLVCLKSTGIACNGAGNSNAMRVNEQADVPTLFARVFGIPSWRITTTATASAKGGSAAPLDVMIVLDTTQSMNGADSSCTLKNATRLDCALNGVRILLASMPPCAQNLGTCNGAAPLVQVGLMVFPGIGSATQAPRDYDCSSTPAPTIAKYNASPAYEILPLGSDYRVSAAAGLNTNSNLVRAARGGASNCQQGISAIGGVGTYYSDAITTAQSALISEGRTSAQKVLILLSDGDASAKSGDIASGKLANQCAQAITAAKAATTAGTWVYSIAYGASTSATGSCSTDSPKISACSTLQQIASDSTKFFSDTVGGSSTCTSAANSITNLSSIFSAIVTDVTGVRLVSDDTT